MDKQSKTMAQTINPDVLTSIQAYVAALRAHRMSFESVWLFGSFAENRADQDSDIDLAVVMPQVRQKFFKEVELTRFRRNIDSRIEPHVVNAVDLNGLFYKDVISRGIKIA